jgi:hypothetical protein
MNLKNVLFIFIFIYAFLIVQDQCQEISPNDVPDGDPNKIAGC